MSKKQEALDLRIIAKLKGRFKYVAGRLATKCWLWTGNTVGAGYPLFNINKVRYNARRESYRLLKRMGDPGKFQVMSACRNPGCINPDHLYVEPTEVAKGIGGRPKRSA